MPTSAPGPTGCGQLYVFLAGPDGKLGTDDDRRAYMRWGHEMNGGWCVRVRGLSVRRRACARCVCARDVCARARESVRA